MGEQRASGQERANIYDVARLAGVSHMTVSRVLNGHPSIRDATRDRVTQAIEALKFQRSASARALATRRTMRLGVLVDNPVEYGPNSMLHAFEAAAQVAGYTVGSFTATEEKGRGADAALETLFAQDIDGLCAITPRASSLHLLQQREIQVPTILIIPEAVPEMSTASVDQFAGARIATQHLIDLGHQSIAHLGGPLDWFDARERERGWRETCLAAGLELGPFHEGDWTADFGYDWALHVDPDEFSAVFVANDQMALGVMHGLSTRGIRVPHDISIVGFDDVPDSSHYMPPLTTVRQDFKELGRIAMELLAESLAQSTEPRRVTLQPDLIIRQSTEAR